MSPSPIDCKARSISDINDSRKTISGRVFRHMIFRRRNVDFLQTKKLLLRFREYFHVAIDFIRFFSAINPQSTNAINVVCQSSYYGFDGVDNFTGRFS